MQPELFPKLFPKLFIDRREILPGSRTTLAISLPPLHPHMTASMPVHIVRGAAEGPRLFVSAAVHGDELNGIEIIRRMLKLPALSRLRGMLIAVPVVNAYGLVHHSRYLVDRCDLNRSFPGSEIGSIPSRIAWSFMQEVVMKCSHGIDLHTGGIHHANLPQVRADMDHAETRRIASAFRAPIIIDDAHREGSLRATAAACGITTLVYEAGQALRFDERCIRTGVDGIVNVMRELDMLDRKDGGPPEPASSLARSSFWMRAPAGGLLRLLKPLGALVHEGELIALVDTLFEDASLEIRAMFMGIIIGRKEIPIVREGEAFLHMACFDEPENAARRIRKQYGDGTAGQLPPRKNEPQII